MSITIEARLARKTPAAKDAITQLKADHAKVSSLFAEYEKAQSTTKKKALVADLCAELSVHAQIEAVEPDGEMYDAKVKVLSEYVKHHVKAEQNEMFPKVKASSLDLLELGARMAARKANLLALRA